MNKQIESQEIVVGEKLTENLGRAIESVDAKLLDITGGIEQQPAEDGDIYICKSRCA